MSPPPPPPPPPMSGGEESPFSAARDHPKGTTVLVLGILSLVCCGVLGPIAWVMGNNALAEIDAAPGAYSNRGTVTAGKICGIVGTALLALGALYFIVIAGALL